MTTTDEADQIQHIPGLEPTEEETPAEPAPPAWETRRHPGPWAIVESSSDGHQPTLRAQVHATLAAIDPDLLWPKKYVIASTPETANDR